MAQIINGQEAADLVEGGGTGLLTITDHSVIVGSGTDPVTPITVGTTGQVYWVLPVQTLYSRPYPTLTP